jgi:hypothetical protein
MKDKSRLEGASCTCYRGLTVYVLAITSYPEAYQIALTRPHR